MKRKFLFSLVFVALFAALSFAQSFTDFSVDIPSGYSAHEDEYGGVWIENPDNMSDYVYIYMANRPSGSLSSIAQSYCDDYNGENLMIEEGGYYSFYFVDGEYGYGASVLVDDSSTDSRIPSGEIRIMEWGDDMSEDNFNYVFLSFSAGVSGDGGGSSRRNSSDSDSSSGGCDTGLGILTLGLAVVFFKKR